MWKHTLASCLQLIKSGCLNELETDAVFVGLHILNH